MLLLWMHVLMILVLTRESLAMITMNVLRMSLIQSGYVSTHPSPVMMGMLVLLIVVILLMVVIIQYTYLVMMTTHVHLILVILSQAVYMSLPNAKMMINVQLIIVIRRMGAKFLL